MERLSERRLREGSTRKVLGSSTSTSMDDVLALSRVVVRDEYLNLGCNAVHGDSRTSRSSDT